MKLNKIISTIALGSLLFTGCADKFAELNQSKSAVSAPNASRLFAEAVIKFEPQGYLEWYYNAPMMYNWNQWGVPTGGVLETMLTTTATGDKGGQSINVLRYVREIDHLLSTENDADAAKDAVYYHATNVLAIYLGIFDTDLFGSIPYSEACRYLYDGILLPKYDSQEELFTLWLEDLDKAIAALSADGASMTASQDAVFKGDCMKWAKFANSLKLRIAARLVNADKAKALQIANAVASASCGYIATIDDAVIFNKNTKTDGGDITYHWSNGFMTNTAANANVVDFMVDNLDPRVRFCYTKNNWSSTIIKAYYERGEEIPPFIEEDVDFEVVNGKKVFKGWKGAGEPWVRYHGLPTGYNAGHKDSPNYNEWCFDYAEHNIKKMDGTGGSSYRPWSYFNLMLVNGRTYQFTNFLPIAPDDVRSYTTVGRPWYGMYLGAGETNLYLAEFALYNGGNLGGKSAEAYYNAGLEASVKEYDKLCSLNQVAYYGNTYDYDPLEGKIDLVDGEIATMMAHDQYKLTGSADEKLEKVILQQLINFTMYPNENFVTSRRTGFPKVGSSLIARETYTAIPVNAIPRRFDTGIPQNTDKMYQIKIDAIKAQGFTATSDGLSGSNKFLHDERVWYDKNAPEWGAGSKAN